MSCEIGKAALNLQWTERVARTEYNDNWEIVRHFTGRDPRFDPTAANEFSDAIHLDFLGLDAGTVHEPRVLPKVHLPPVQEALEAAPRRRQADHLLLGRHVRHVPRRPRRCGRGRLLFRADERSGDDDARIRPDARHNGWRGLPDAPFGTKEGIEKELRWVFDLARDCPGFVLATGNHFPASIPLENALFYFELAEELGRRGA